MGNIARKIQITSGWYDVQDVTNLLFGGKISTTMYYSELFEEDICMMGCGGMNPIFEDEYNEEVPNIKASDLKYRPTKITMKVMADMYFNQYSYLNEEINTNQVFTYLLLDESQNINLIGDQGNLISEGSINSFVNMYPGELTIETPTIYPNCPEIILSNSDLPFTIRADKVVVDSYMAGLSTFEYSVEAYSQIHLKPGAQIYRKFNFKINKSTYGGETSAPASPSEVSSFCSTGSYNAGSASAISKERSRIYDQIAENKNQIINQNGEKSLLLFPNPAHHNVNIQLNSGDIEVLSVYDLTGHLLTQKNNLKGGFISFNLSTIQSGTYIIQVESDGEILKEKLTISL